MHSKIQQDLKQALSAESTSAAGQWIRRLFFIFLWVSFLTAGAILFALGKEAALLIAVFAVTGFWALETFEARRWSSRTLGLKVTAGPLLVAGIIFLVALMSCLPTLNIYFMEDDLAFIHAFHHLSSTQFLQLFHMDTSEFVRGDARQEFRPLYSLLYVAAFRVWGLHPWGYHLCLILLHSTVAILVFLITKTIAPGDQRRACLAAVLFAVQPLNAQVTSLLEGSVAECLPAVLYLTAFLYFIHFRSSGRLLYLALSFTAFATCLLAKESAVTLPIMIASYDLLSLVVDKRSPLIRAPGRKGLANLIWPYLPYLISLFTYLEWRHKIFTSYVREADWGKSLNPAVSSHVEFGLHLSHFTLRVWQLLVFDFDTLFPYPVLVLAAALAFIAFWFLSLSRNRSCTRSMAVVLYFCLIWQVISNLPYLIEMHVIYHLYLPSVGICIGLATLAFPCREGSRQQSGVLRLAGMLLLILVSTIQMWKADAEYRRFGDMSARMTAQLALGLKSIPKGALVVLWPDKSEFVASGWGEELLPFSVEPPFTSTDLYSNLIIVEHPDMSCCGVGGWWPRVSSELTAELAGPSRQEITLYSLSWDDGTGTFQQTNRVIPRSTLGNCISALLGGTPESIDSIDEDQGIRLVKALTDLVKNDTNDPQKN